MPSTVRQVGSFALVGVFNTILDFVVFNIVHLGGHLGPVTANFISTTIAMTISFLINRRYVFGGGRRHAAHQAAAFLAVTAFGVYVLQGTVIYLVTAKLLHSTGPLASNVGKLLGTGVSLVWNFLLYKRLVFV